jgi:membrane protease YdiL (CAAX protease family)
VAHPVDGGAQRTPGIWVWRRWTRWTLTPAILAVALVAIAIDVVTAWRNVDIGSLGPIPTSPALPLGILLALMVGLRRLGLDRTNLAAWREFLVVGALVLGLAVWHYAVRIGDVREAGGLILAALDEELVYRLAVLIVVGACTAALLGRRWRNPEDWGIVPGAVALLGSGLVFALLPGHVAQMSSTSDALPFISLGMVLGYVVLRTGALFPAVVVHASLNLVTIADLHTASESTWRAAFAATALVALALGTIVAGLRLGMLQRFPRGRGWRPAT